MKYILVTAIFLCSFSTLAIVQPSMDEELSQKVQTESYFTRTIASEEEVVEENVEEKAESKRDPASAEPVEKEKFKYWFQKY
ncbi:MAG: hypothetical protein ACOCUH_00915 [Bacteriovoracia bacterium]